MILSPCRVTDGRLYTGIGLPSIFILTGGNIRQQHYQIFEKVKATLRKYALFPKGRTYNSMNEMFITDDYCLLRCDTV
jgi:hypothetical protein